MNTEIAVQVPTGKFLEFAAFLRAKGDRRDPVIAIWDAIDYWVQNADWKPELLSKTDMRGYQWKSPFLPSGTQIRMPYKGRYYYANVEGDQLVYENRPTTPGRLANSIASSSRNAWRDLWIKRPEDNEWRLADECRRENSEDGVAESN